MAMKTRYNAVGGEIVSEQRSGVKSFYMPDAIGSTIAVTDNAGTVTDQINYWPHGAIVSRTGSSQTPFLFVGALGYYTDSSDRGYVRARYIQNSDARWLTADPLGFDAGDWSLYVYASNNPVLYTDATGLYKTLQECRDAANNVHKKADDFCYTLKGIYKDKCLMDEAYAWHMRKMGCECQFKTKNCPTSGGGGGGQGGGGPQRPPTLPPPPIVGSGCSSPSKSYGDCLYCCTQTFGPSTCDKMFPSKGSQHTKCLDDMMSRETLCSAHCQIVDDNKKNRPTPRPPTSPPMRTA